MADFGMASSWLQLFLPVTSTLSQSTGLFNNVYDSKRFLRLIAWALITIMNVSLFMALGYEGSIV